MGEFDLNDIIDDTLDENKTDNHFENSDYINKLTFRKFRPGENLYYILTRISNGE